MSFKICSIGCGSMATTGHGPSCRLYADCHADTVLAACCDLDDAKASIYQQRFGYQRCYTDLEIMLDREKPDAVCLVVPENLTAAIAIRILEKGYPLLMEKPPGLNLLETKQMILAADQYGVPTQVALNRRYMPMVTWLKDEVAREPGLDAINNLRYDFYRVARFDADFAATAIHGIDTARFLAGSDYQNIRFHYQPFPEFGPDVANILLDCTFASGATAQLSFCPVSGVIVERAVINAWGHTWFMNLPVWNANDFPGSLVHYQQGRLTSEYPGDQAGSGLEMFITNGFYRENEAFFDDIRAGRRPAGDLRSALQSVEIADCIRLRKLEYGNDLVCCTERANP